jgi:DNA primase
VGIVDEDIGRVRAAVPILDAVQQFGVQLRRVGRSWQGLCPFHAEKSPSFNINEQTGRYKCFGCGVGGDVIAFVRETEHLDFVGAMELLAGRAGLTLHYDTGIESRDHLRRKPLVEAMQRAVDWYHDRLLLAPDARPAREYLKSRGITGDVARQFKLGWAPDAWDTLCRDVGLSASALRDTGLGFLNRRDRLQDTFRARVMFPILNEQNEAVAFGGRILPGSADPAKYKNSPETAIYAKSKTLYGLNWAKTDVVAADQVIVCEGYTDVIGFHRSGVPRAVATCGTALTEDHVKLLRRFAGRVVLAFDADAAGEAAAERFYEWERRYDMAVSVARLPAGRDPGDLASSDPAALRSSVEDPLPFLQFRVQRALAGRPPTTPEARARAAEAALAVVNEHPNVIVRREYAGEIAARLDLPARDLVALAERGSTHVTVATTPRRSTRETAEVAVVWLLVHRWDEIAPWLVETLFDDDVALAAFRALAGAEGDLDQALATAEPAAREMLERLAVDDLDVDPGVEARNLIRAATRRQIDRWGALGDPEIARTTMAEGQRLLEVLDDAVAGPDAATRLLGWLVRHDPDGNAPMEVTEQS